MTGRVVLMSHRNIPGVPHATRDATSAPVRRHHTGTHETIEHAVMGLTLARVPVAAFHTIHQHNEIEISVTEGGVCSTLFGDRRCADN